MVGKGFTAEAGRPPFFQAEGEGKGKEKGNFEPAFLEAFISQEA